ncbi:MAG: hypothetical protein PHW76_05190 [Alphaproteobacteria bacterium]|nr:hypothetical protein [Alphaproteobacteria bacterium]
MLYSAPLRQGFPARSSNLRKIHQTLTDHGIEFLQGAGIQLRSKGFHDFIGAESCDDFFDYAQRTIRDRGGDLVCMIAEMDMLTKTCCSSGLTNIQRLEQIQKTASVKCLIDETLMGKDERLPTGIRHKWTEAQIKAFKDVAPDRLILAMDIALCTAQRLDDVLNMTWAQIDGATINLIQGKTGEELWIPMHRMLLKTIAKHKKIEPQPIS